MDVKYNFYADDSELFSYLSAESCANSFHQLNTCLNDIHTCRFENKLQLNPEKTEFMLKDIFLVYILGNWKFGKLPF